MRGLLPAPLVRQSVRAINTVLTITRLHSNTSNRELTNPRYVLYYNVQDYEQSVPLKESTHFTIDLEYY